MTFAQWLDGVPRELTEDPLWRMEVYRLSVFAADYRMDHETIPADVLTNVPMPL